MIFDKDQVQTPAQKKLHLLPSLSGTFLSSDAQVFNLQPGYTWIFQIKHCYMNV